MCSQVGIDCTDEVVVVVLILAIAITPPSVLMVVIAVDGYSHDSTLDAVFLG